MRAMRRISVEVVEIVRHMRGIFKAERDDAEGEGVNGLYEEEEEDED